MFIVVWLVPSQDKDAEGMRWQTDGAYFTSVGDAMAHALVLPNFVNPTQKQARILRVGTVVAARTVD